MPLGIHYWLLSIYIYIYLVVTKKDILTYENNVNINGQIKSIVSNLKGTNIKLFKI